MDDLMDFTEERPPAPIRFLIDGDTFEAAAVLPGGVTHDLASMQGRPPHEQVILLGHVLEAIMLPESAKLFAARLRDPERPITDRQVGQVIRWLVEQYGQRPTTPASPSQLSASAGSES